MLLNWTGHLELRHPNIKNNWKFYLWPVLSSFLSIINHELSPCIHIQRWKRDSGIFGATHLTLLRGCSTKWPPNTRKILQCFLSKMLKDENDSFAAKFIYLFVFYVIQVYCWYSGQHSLFKEWLVQPKTFCTKAIELKKLQFYIHVFIEMC